MKIAVSGRKPLLRLAALLVAVNLLAASTCLTLGLSGLVTPQALQPYVMTAFLLVFPVWAVAVQVAVEFIGASRPRLPWWQRARGLSFTEMKQLVLWCLRPYYSRAWARSRSA